LEKLLIQHENELERALQRFSMAGSGRILELRIEIAAIKKLLRRGEETR
jgi:hypothetical protein